MEPICYLCGEPIKDNKGTYWIKGTGGIFSRGVYPSTIVSAHWGKCANVVGKYFDQFPPDEKGESWFWNHLPFYTQSDEKVTNSNRFIYVLKSTESYKIGITKDVAKRMRELQTGDPVKHLFVCSSFFEDAPRFEKLLHEAFAEYRVENSEWFELPPEKLEELIEILENKNFIEQVPPLNNVVYYPPGTRVLWRNQPGIVHSLVIKSYKYEVGYNIILDSQNYRDDPEVSNSGYDELILEDVGIPSKEGYEVEPIKPNISEDGIRFFKLGELMELHRSQQSDGQGDVR
ncbi:GIY-YIG nuclease family protein [Nostoc sp. C057]|uniref:GIY-YIG nuclease family protein n=1 Tax=Nostoc sp. C057 TaxID=2576903 RepID=UPI0015C400C4|nr:GIY-YIG nuclease family protein [Nostoc sp. C057]QLE51761.1 GIY-YIG nuclease family protein [Nostoc sp. C057]